MEGEGMNTNTTKLHYLSVFVFSVLCLWQFHTIATADALDGAVLILTFDKADMKMEGGDPAEINDLSGNENHGLINGKGGDTVGGDPPEIVEGKYGDALRFSGQNWVEVVDSETLCITDALTMAAWVNPESMAGEQTICTKDRCYYMQLRNGMIGNYTQNLSIQGYHETPDTVPLEEWSHIAMSWDGSTLVQYLNGESVNSVNTSGQINITDDSIGIGAEVRIPSRGAAEWRFYTGTIDEVLVFSVSKTESEIKEIMAGKYLSVSMQDKLATTWGRLK
jgi:hypothetical protein